MVTVRIVFHGLFIHILLLYHELDAKPASFIPSDMPPAPAYSCDRIPRRLSISKSTKLWTK
jgi:hypothetical protein